VGIVLISGGHAVVADFGIAKAVGDARDASVATTLTMAGTSIGTPVYMAPEQAAGEGNVDHRADIYALGAMLFEMCAGVPPFTGTMHQVITQKLSKTAPSLAASCPAASTALVQLVARCLEIDPAARPQSATALLTALRAIAAPRSERSGASRRTVVMATSAALAIVAIAAAFVVRDQRARWVHDTAIPSIQ